MDGTEVRRMEGVPLGIVEGASEGRKEGLALCRADGGCERLGVPDGISVGSKDGCRDGESLGVCERVKVGEALGTTMVKLKSHPFVVASSCRSHILLLTASSASQLLGTHQGPVM